MLTHLDVKDFQKAKLAGIDLAPVTLLVGHNSAGKSAILRALHSLCFNRTGDWFIRKAKDGSIRPDEDGASCALTLEDGSVVSWWKERGKSAGYSIDSFDEHGQPYQPRVFTKTGSVVPDEVADALKVRRIEVDSTFSITPQFRMQHDGLLIKESGSRLARILGSLTKLDVVVKAQMLCRRDRDRAKREKETAEEEAGRLQEQVQALDWVPGVRKEVDDIKETLDLAGQVATRYQRVRELIADRQRLQAIVQRRVGVGQALDKLAEASTLMQTIEHARPLIQRYAQYAGAAAHSLRVSVAREKHGEAAALVSLLSCQYVEEHRLLSNKVERLGAARTMALGEFKRTEELYRTACDDADLCEKCPLREGV